MIYLDCWQLTSNNIICLRNIHNLILVLLRIKYQPIISQFNNRRREPSNIIAPFARIILKMSRKAISLESKMKRRNIGRGEVHLRMIGLGKRRRRERRKYKNEILSEKGRRSIGVKLSTSGKLRLPLK